MMKLKIKHRGIYSADGNEPAWKEVVDERGNIIATGFSDDRDLPDHIKKVISMVNEFDQMYEACKLAEVELERITGDIGFEPERFRERMRAHLALAMAIKNVEKQP